MKRPIFVLGCHKSGTGLVRSLIDGAPEVFCIPFETHFFRQVGDWVEYPLRACLPESRTMLDFASSVKKWVRRVKTTDDRAGGSVNSACDQINLESFDCSLREGLKTIGSLDTRLSTDIYQPLFLVYANAIASSFGGNSLGSERLVEKSVDHLEFAPLLSKMFGDASFIHILRNPYANISSLRSYKSNHGYPNLTPLIRSIYSSFYYAHKNKQIIDNYHTIRYENLVSQTKKEMEQALTSIDVKYSSKNLKPTVFGSHWYGNSSTEQDLKDVSLKRARSWKNEVEALEICAVNSVFDNLIETFGYERIDSSLSLLPKKGEGFIRYIKNRLLSQRGLDNVRFRF